MKNRKEKELIRLENKAEKLLQRGSDGKATLRAVLNIVLALLLVLGYCFLWRLSGWRGI